MAIDIHPLNFLRYIKKNKGDFGKVATIGRQRLFIPEKQMKIFFDPNFIYKNDEEKYCEKMLLNYFGASEINSYDYSDFEGATDILDLNLPFKGNKKYDTIIDVGTLEHIFNIPQALENLSNMCNINGQIILVLPANSTCGHGFYQFSPELFFTLFSPENGFGETEIFLADMTNEKKWWRIDQPKSGERVEIQSHNQVLILCRTKKINQNVVFKRIQQSDYLDLWKVDKEEINKKLYENVKDKSLLSKLVKKIKVKIKSLFLTKSVWYHKNNPYIKHVNIKDII